MKQLLLLSGLALGACSTAQSPGPRPVLPPVDYRASGNDPAWELTIDRGAISFLDRSNRVRVIEPAPPRMMIAAGMPIRTRRMQIVITRSRCEDVLTRRSFPERVRVDVDGRRFDGCGGNPLTTSLANSSWVVEEVNGRATGGGPRFAMQFTGNRTTSRFGCNTVTGAYTVTSITFSAGAQASTRMACPDMTFEQQALGVLSQPATLLWSSADQVTIGSEKGQIKLRRAL